jgi:hypothetical protein
MRGLYTDLRNELMYTINYPVTIDLNLLLKEPDTLCVYQNIDITRLDHMHN